MHAGIRAPTASPKHDLQHDKACGFHLLTARELDRIGMQGVIDRLRAKVAGTKVYISVDIDVLDPAFAPATGTAEVGGWTTRELLTVLDGLAGIEVIGGDVGECARDEREGLMLTMWCSGGGAHLRQPGRDDAVGGGRGGALAHLADGADAREGQAVMYRIAVEAVGRNVRQQSNNTKDNRARSRINLNNSSHAPPATAPPESQRSSSHPAPPPASPPSTSPCPCLL